MTTMAVFDLTTAVVGVLGGGFFAGLGALLKVKPERDAFVVTGAKDVLLMQGEVLDEIKQDRARLREDLKARDQDLARERAARERCEEQLRGPSS